MKFFKVLLFALLGVLAGIFIAPHLRGAVAMRVVPGIVIFLAVAIVYSAIRYYIVSQSRSLKAPAENEQKSEVGFVVDTFHELVGKLKEKEKELERLRTVAEDRAGSLETYNENILQSVPSGVISIDNSMKIKSINQSAEKILGIKADDACDKDCAEIFDEPLIGVVKDHKTLARGEYSYLTRDKRHVWLGLMTSQLKNAAGEIIGLILVFTDLTEVKALQAQVELKKRLTQLGEMSAGIAHELRNPMSVIAGYAKLLDKKVGESNKATVNAILTEIKHLDTLISEFLAFAKPTDLNRTRLDLKKMIEDTVSTAMAGNEKIRVSIRSEDSLSIMADEVLLRQAFTNLFINSVDAMPEGGDLTVEVNMMRDKAGITITDTGHGIPDDIKKKIFLPFYTSRAEGV
ncbi:MAG TPA: PAS domain S-box protein, partial [Nitrospirae bacterium]|nr:PAS domain S-box protein [Nitrospirota bacterium]